MPAADIYHLHWISAFIDFRSLPLLARRAPIVWTFHDMNAFTGGCHYDRNCGRYADHCGACPVLGSDKAEDVSFRTIQRKSQILRALPKSRLVAVSPSEWLANETRRSHLFGDFITRVIPYGIDLTMFKPVDRTAVRTRLGFAPDERVVLFVAEDLTDERKGLRQMLEALTPLKDIPKLRILTMGKAGDSTQMPAPLFRHLGRLSNPVEIRDAYNAADLFCITSLQDNFPNTVIEALACGTPVAGFATGGVVDAVQQDVGLLTPTGDIAGLANCLRTILEDDERRNAMRNAARKRAEANYGEERQAHAYRALYEELLHGGIA